MAGKLLDCPQCGIPTLYSIDNPDRPFCSKRCRMIDLGEWASEGYQIAAEPEFDEFSSDMLEDPGMMQTRH
ncbi:MULTISPECIES: DNA gyrase inhibitor YacG [Marinobacterium]|jgi:endogenous inhibitor of DNA gyrase (YacG/DUF329 family)|uniref:DNA gyrase inhibitor YacG n=1 Tax=Marinobacterium iners DSM 11526 TaxID=1122198 RepID=A0A1H4BSM8_9GAMM|nr:DNA gyrase inhibitor YacG [Marinobacterium iners]QSR36062.1 DNA gyrase inhibitor YacG [Marinobacterium iners]SEA51113.1 hypothetical protein SAMN02745729_10451 [Marinobacterium iners DSM 11526]